MIVTHLTSIVNLAFSVGLVVALLLCVSHFDNNSASPSVRRLLKGIRMPTDNDAKRSLKPYTDAAFATYAFHAENPFTPDDTIGRTSFAMFDKALHVEKKFNLPDEFKPNRGKDALDFIIAGFPKCGTSYMKNIFHDEDNIKMFNTERCNFFRGHNSGRDTAPLALVKELEGVYKLKEEHQKIAFKCPAAITDEAFDHIFSTYYPETDIMIAIRHPVHYFRSYYNYKLRSRAPNGPVAFVNELFGSKCHLTSGVCTDGVKFALPLSKLGKTDLGQDEIELLASMVYEKDPDHDKKQQAVTEYLSTLQKPKLGRVFLFALEQIIDEDQQRQKQLLKDMSAFIGLDHEIEQEVVILKGHDKHVDANQLNDSEEEEGGTSRHLNSYHEYYVDPKSKWEYDKQSDLVKKEARKRHNHMQIDICEPTYNEIRKLMVEESKKTVQWIRDYFLNGEEVVVSNREYFESVLDGYTVDPCR